LAFVFYFLFFFPELLGYQRPFFIFFPRTAGLSATFAYGEAEGSNFHIRCRASLQILHDSHYSPTNKCQFSFPNSLSHFSSWVVKPFLSTTLFSLRTLIIAKTRAVVKPLFSQATKNTDFSV